MTHPSSTPDVPPGRRRPGTWRRRSARLALATLAVTGLVAGTGCGGQSSASGSGKITLTITDWGDFGYRSLIREYQQQHPDIRILERNLGWGKAHDALTEQLRTGKGEADVAAVDDSFITQFVQQKDGFYNLLDFGAGALQNRWFDWKWRQSLSADGTYQIGLGTDVGGLGICYRSDLLRKAGLPTDRNELARRWSTWEAYLEMGRRFEAAKVGAHWVDGVTSLYLAMQAQQKIGYYDETGHVAVADNAELQHSFSLALQAVTAGESARLVSGSTEQSAALQGGQFATITCPAWELATIQSSAPQDGGKWDLAMVPGGGAGNWGGSFLTVPRQTKHPREAYQLAAWLTAPEQQLKIFQETGNLPSQPSLYSEPAVHDFRNAYASGAPVGQIYAASVQKLRPQVLGPRTSAIRAVMEQTLRKVESGDLASSQAWTTAVTGISALK